MPWAHRVFVFFEREGETERETLKEAETQKETESETHRKSESEQNTYLCKDTPKKKSLFTRISVFIFTRIHVLHVFVRMHDHQCAQVIARWARDIIVVCCSVLQCMTISAPK